ncbi:MAG: DUF1622 domain-containing protein [Streptosporangiaceae bacterium]
MVALASAGADAGSTFATTMNHVAQGFEVLGAVVLVVGAVWSCVLSVLVWRRSGSARRGYTTLRQAFGGSLLLGLEVLVAADLIRTVAVAPTLANVGVLGLIVLIRTFLSFSLETEINGVVPWRRAMIPGSGMTGSGMTGSGMTRAGGVPAPASERGQDR